jgi:hypothetical protein
LKGIVGVAVVVDPLFVDAHGLSNGVDGLGEDGSGDGAGAGVPAGAAPLKFYEELVGEARANKIGVLVSSGAAGLATGFDLQPAVRVRDDLTGKGRGGQSAQGGLLFGVTGAEALADYNERTKQQPGSGSQHGGVPFGEG